MIEIKRVRAEELYPMRLELLRGGSTDVSKAVFDGDDEKDSKHFMLREGGEEAGIVTVIRRSGEFEGKVFQMRGLAVKEEKRRKGYAAALIKAAEYYVFIEMGAEILWLNSRTRVIGLYEKAGYKSSGELFEIEGVGEHILMYKKREDYKTGCCSH